MTQIRRLGASVDWTRERFTMDEVCCKAVIEAFVNMHERKKIYRANRMINWSCALRTAISSIEVEHFDVKKSTLVSVPGYEEKVEVGVLHSFAYKMKDPELGEIVVATTRMETMLGDVAVAVHPDDPRYQHLIGKPVVHPFIPNREMIVIADGELVDMKFGTGCVKITPAHDVNDFKCGKRHKLREINILNGDGTINENGGPFAGQPRFTARVNVIEALTKLGVYKGKENNEMSIGKCSRSGDLIEPVLRPQWFVDTTSMAARAVAAVRNGELKITPESNKSTWYHFLEEADAEQQQWCISRQLWWGHRIPAWRPVMPGKTFNTEKDDSWIVARSLAEAKEIAAKRFPGYTSLEQDPDVLDTWFSSGLFPFSVFQWPKKK